MILTPAEQAEGKDVWREAVRDGARSGGGDMGPTPQPLSQRLSGLMPGAAGGDDVLEEMVVLTSDVPPTAVVETEESEKEQARGGDLRLDDPGEKPQGPEAGSGSPNRGPPKTPKRNKASSPQLSNVRIRAD